MSPSLHVARNEWRLILKEPRFLLLFLMAPLLLVLLQALYVFGSVQSGITPQDADILTRVQLVVGLLIAGSAVSLGADSFAGERERNSLEILLCTPLTLEQIFQGKMLGVLPLPLLTGLSGQLLVGLMVSLGTEWGFGYWAEGWKAMALLPFYAFFITAAAIWFSLRSGSVRSAAQMSSFLMLLVLFLLLGTSEAYFRLPAYRWGLWAFLSIGGLLLSRMSWNRFQAYVP